MTNWDGSDTIYFSKENIWILKEVFEHPNNLTDFLKKITEYVGLFQGTEKSEMFEELNSKFIMYYDRLDEVNENAKTSKG